MYYQQNSIQFDTMYSSNTEKGNNKHSNCPSIYIAVPLTVKSQEFLSRGQFVNEIIIWNLNSFATVNTKHWIVNSMNLKTTFSNLVIYLYHYYFSDVFLIIILYYFKYFNLPCFKK